MQLMKKNVKSTLLAASCSLLAGNTAAEEWSHDAAIMYYGEADRVQAIEGIFQSSKALKNEGEISTKVVIDSLTGASASGAVPQSTAQTFTTPSGNGEYVTNANETPLDDTFLDTRVQVGADWTQPIGTDYVVSAGANISKEYDYESLAFSGGISRYLDNKNTTLSLGASVALDSLDPVGERPIGLSEMVKLTDFANQGLFDAAFDATRQTSGEDGRDTFDLIFGLTQVIDRRWITQFNLSFSEVDGYLTDPYKIISVVDGSGNATSELYENRPDSRSKQALYAQSKYHFDNAIWDVSYRFTDDDWGIQSHTLESRYRFLLADSSYLEPHIRIYQQSEADFYRPFLLDSDPTPQFASADYRIGKLNTYTLGVKYGKELSGGREYGVRLEYYIQEPQDGGTSRPGQLASQDLYESLDALILQYDYKF